MKAILVFNNMPTNCNECEVECDGYTAKQYAEKGITRPSWCPLRPLPQIIEYETTDTQTAKAVALIDNAFKLGWNTCLNVITGELNAITGETE